MGIEPTFSAWEADVLPLNYTRKGTCILTWMHRMNRINTFCHREHRGFRNVEWNAIIILHILCIHVNL